MIKQIQRKYYVDPKSPGSLCFLGSKERVRLPLHEEHCSVEALKKHTVAHAGLKTEAEKRGSLIELKLCRLAKTAEGSKAFSINTQAQWEVDRPLFGNSTVLQGLYYDLLPLTLQMPYLAVATCIIEETEYILSQLRKTTKIENAFVSWVYIGNELTVRQETTKFKAGSLPLNIYAPSAQSTERIKIEHVEADHHEESEHDEE